MFGGQSNLCSSTHDFRVQADGVITDSFRILLPSNCFIPNVDGQDQTEQRTLHASCHQHFRQKMALELSSEPMSFSSI